MDDETGKVAPIGIFCSQTHPIQLTVISLRLNHLPFPHLMERGTGTSTTIIVHIFFGDW